MSDEPVHHGMFSHPVSATGSCAACGEQGRIMYEQALAEQAQARRDVGPWLIRERALLDLVERLHQGYMRMYKDGPEQSCVYCAAISRPDEPEFHYAICPCRDAVALIGRRLTAP